MEIEQVVENGILILRLRGELDLTTAPDIKKAVERAFLGTQLKHVVVNMSNVSFVDSSGIGVILGRYKELNQGGGQLVLVNPQPHVETVLELSGLARVIPFVPTESEALKVVSAGRGQRDD